MSMGNKQRKSESEKPIQPQKYVLPQLGGNGLTKRHEDPKIELPHKEEEVNK